MVLFNNLQFYHSENIFSRYVGNFLNSNFYSSLLSGTFSKTFVSSVTL